MKQPDERTVLRIAMTDALEKQATPRVFAPATNKPCPACGRWLVPADAPEWCICDTCADDESCRRSHRPTRS